MTSQIPKIVEKFQHFAILFIHLCYPHAFAFKLFETAFYSLSVKTFAYHLWLTVLTT